MDENRENVCELADLRLISTNLEKRMCIEGFDFMRRALIVFISVCERFSNRYILYQSPRIFRLCAYGSLGEGLVYPIHSQCERDIDMVYIFQNIVATENALDRIKYNTETMICLIENDQSIPGYCYLRVINEGSVIGFPDDFISSYAMQKVTGLFMSRCDFPTGIANAISLALGDVESGDLGHQGPASNFHITPACQLLGSLLVISKMDTVFVIPCPNWPSSANEWVSRVRTYGWPTDRQIKHIVDQGICFAPVGRKKHLLEGFQWRYSFNEAERCLVRSFNPTQAKCYVLLKRIISEYVTVQFKEDFISSYHLKTLMFWTIEETDSIVWIPANLVQCTFLVLNRLVQCVDRIYCPSYFMPDENLFINKITSENKGQLVAIFRCIIAEGWPVLIRLTNFAMDPSFDYRLHHDYDTEESEAPYEILSDDYIALVAAAITQNEMLQRYLQAVDVHEIHEADKIHSTFSQIINTSILEAYACEDTHSKETIKDVISSVCSSYGTHLLSLARHLILDMQEIFNNEALGDMYMEISCWRNQTDCLAKNANYAYMRGNFKSTFSTAYNVLQRYFSRPVNAFNLFVPLQVQAYSLLSSVTALFKQGNMTDFKTMLESIVWSRDVIFMRNEIHAIPDNAKVEMFVSDERECPLYPHSRLRNCMVVDPYFYVAYLTFLAFCDMELPEEADKVLQTMETICTVLPNSHLSVSLNLLGDCYLKRGKADKAIEKFVLSMKRSNKRNAAPWHVARIVWRKLLDM